MTTKAYNSSAVLSLNMLELKFSSLSFISPSLKWKKTKIHWNNWCSPVDVAISSRCFWAIYSNNLPNVYNSFSNLQTSSHHHPIPRVNGITTCRTFLLYIHTSFQEHLDNFKITLHDSHVDRINCFSSGEASTSPAQSMPTTERN